MPPPVTRLPIVGVMGSGSRPYVERASALGRWLAECGVHLLTGGGAGVMTAVSKSFYETPHRSGLVIGILPCDESLEESRDGGPKPKDGYPNPWVEIPVLTHLPLSGQPALDSDGGAESMSRNHINVLSSDVIVALPGDTGTLDEVRLAVRYQRPVIAFIESDRELLGLPASVPISCTLEGVRTFVTTQLGLSAPQGKSF